MSVLIANKIVADLHVDTSKYMDANQAKGAALGRWLEYIAITNPFYGHGDNIQKHLELERLHELPRILEKERVRTGSNLKCLSGIKVHIGQKIDDIDKIKDLQVRLGCLDEMFWGIKFQDITALEREVKDMIERKSINVLSRPEYGIDKLNRGRYGVGLTPAVKQYYESIVSLCKKEHILLEVCERTFWEDGDGNYERLQYWLEIAKENENPIIVTSGARVPSEVGNMGRAIQYLNYIEYPKRLVVNTNKHLIDSMFNMPENYKFNVESRLDMEIEEKSKANETR